MLLETLMRPIVNDKFISESQPALGAATQATNPSPVLRWSTNKAVETKAIVEKMDSAMPDKDVLNVEMGNLQAIRALYLHQGLPRGYPKLIPWDTSRQTRIWYWYKPSTP